MNKKKAGIVLDLLSEESEILPSQSKDTSVTIQSPIIDNEHLLENKDATSSQELDSSSSDSTYEQLYKELLDKHEKLNINKIGMEKKLENKNKKIKVLMDQLRYYKKSKYKKHKNYKESNAHINAQILLKKILSDNQIALLSNKKKRVNWTNEEISTAFTLRYYSKKCYIYLRSKLNYPLPSLSTLRKWALKINVSEGILKDVFLMLKLAGEGFSDFEKTVVLQFDEVKVKSTLEYDVSKDAVIGPYSQMQVVMARGLFANWKQPVYIGFDQRMTKELLLQIISELSEISYNVVACVSDCGASNVGLWKELGVNVDNTFFAHPITNENVYMFADAPHLLKLLRNWLIDKGFVLGDGSIIDKSPLQALVDLTSSAEVNPCWKVSQIHLDCEKSQRQNVRLAAQLLSNSVSTGLLRYKPGASKVMAENLGNFIKDVNYWFDIFNSYTPRGSVPTKTAFGLDEINQTSHLGKMINTVSKLRPIGKGFMQIFQKGMLISMHSLLGLFSQLKTNLNISYICTHRLNQDSLENFFFQIRQRGGPDEHPSPLSAIYRIRMIMLGKNPGVFDSKVNTDAKILDEYIIPKVLETANIKTPDAKMEENNELESDSFSSVSSDISTSATNPDFTSASEEVTHDALEYIAGYLAYKYKKTLPNLGLHTYKIKRDNYSIPSWVQQLSYGGLIKPTGSWLKKIKKWNRYFLIYHGQDIRKGPDVSKKLAKMIFKKEKELPYSLVQNFCKLRTIIRMNFQNLKAKLNSRKRRHRDSNASDALRKNSRKLKKIIN